jgi:transposase
MGRVEILSGRECRRFWSDAQKLAVLDEVVSSGLGVAEVARRHDVSLQQVYGWRQDFRRKAAPEKAPALVPVRLVDPVERRQRPKATSEKPTRAARGSRVEIRCLNGRVLIVETGHDPAELKALIRSVEDA